jgi:hypothetical protein
VPDSSSTALDGSLRRRVRRPSDFETTISSGRLRLPVNTNTREGSRPSTVLRTLRAGSAAPQPPIAAPVAASNAVTPRLSGVSESSPRNTRVPSVTRLWTDQSSWSRQIGAPVAGS